MTMTSGRTPATGDGVGFLGQTAIIAVTDLGRRLRDRSALITAVAAPLALGIVFGTLFGATSDVRFEIGVADGAGSPTSRAITAGLLDGADDPVDETVDEQAEATDEADDQVVFVVLDTGAAEAAVSDGDVDAALVLRPAANGSIELSVIDHAERPFSGDVAAAVAGNLAARLNRVALATQAATEIGLDPAVGAAAAAAEPYRFDAVDLGGSSIDAMAFFGASMAMVLLFFTTGFAAQSILTDRRTSVLDRMLAVGTRPAALLAGKVISISLLALIGFVVVWAVTSLGFGASWGDPVVVFVLIVATVAALSGVSTFIASFARTEQQSQTLTSVVTFGLALLGGNFTGPANAPAVIDQIADFIPNGVALRAFTEASADDASLGSLWWSLLRLAAFAVVLGGIGLARIRRSIIQ